MRRGVSIGVFVSLATAIAILGACLPEQERTSYGPAESLGSRKFDDPKDGFKDAGAGAEKQLCNGQGPIDGGPCAVSWSRDIFEAMIKPTASMKCSTTNGTCHTTQTPVINGTDAKIAWFQLADHKYDGKQYINVCGKDPETSSMVCNLLGTCPPASRMPSQPGTYATEAQMKTIRDWLACGAPNN